MIFADDPDDLSQKWREAILDRNDVFILNDFIFIRIVNFVNQKIACQNVDKVVRI